MQNNQSSNNSRPRIQPSLKEEQLSASLWNNLHLAGSRVIVTLDSGIPMETITTSAAWILGGVAVVKVQGISGGYRLSRIKPAPEEPEEEEDPSRLVKWEVGSKGGYVPPQFFREFRRNSDGSVESRTYGRAKPGDIVNLDMDSMRFWVEVRP